MSPGPIELRSHANGKPGSVVPLLITLDLHKHRELATCVWESAEFFSRHGQRATYFVPAAYVRMFESLAGTLRQVRSLGHSVGCHGLNHTPDEDLGGLPPEREFALLKEATVILEDALGEPVTSFRAPSYRISRHTLPILDELGYKADLSVTPQHFPLFSSTPWSLERLLAPRSPYHPSKQSPLSRGDLSLLEIPTSCLVMPFAQATILAVPKFACNVMTPLLATEARRFRRAFVLQLHPESVVGKDDWKFPPLRWTDFLPSRSGGFKFRYKFIERDAAKVQTLTLRLLTGCGLKRDLKPISVDDYFAGDYVRENLAEPVSLIELSTNKQA